jgi:putative ABC transport system permease protein
MTLTLPNLVRMATLGSRSLMEHKLRSLLTMLGIIFGVGSVISMLAIGEGASYEAREQIRRLGSTNIIVKARKPESSGSATESRKRMVAYGLTYDDAERIHLLFPRIAVQVPSRVIQEDARRGAAKAPARIIGTVPWYLRNSGLRLTAGRFLTSEDIRGVQNVCILDQSAVRQLFPLVWPIGQDLYLGSQSYSVVGVVESLATASGNGQKGQGEVVQIFIPLTAASRRFGETLVRRSSGSLSWEQVELHELTLTAPTEAAVLPLSNSIRTMLKSFHRQDDFEIVIPLELLKQAEATTRIFNIVLGSIAAISLLVGGIGIMNIMLASVTERTREIGIRRALGATRTDIALQFLAEALVLSLMGGLIGIGLGLAIPAVVSATAGMKTIITMTAIVMAFGIAVVTGLASGLYPATRAARLSPIEALRHE